VTAVAEAPVKAPEEKALATVKAEAKGKRLEDGSTLVPLVTDDGQVLDILMPPPADWFEGAVEALSAGRVSEWVRLAVEDTGVARPLGSPSASATATWTPS
jgi:hypothetical protein